MQTEDEEKSKDGVKDGQGCNSGDAENVSADGKASAGGDGVVSGRGKECDIQDGVGESAGGKEIGAEAGRSDSFEALYSDSKSKNKRRPSPYCDYFGVHLDRHLRSIHGDIVTSKDHEMMLVY